MWPLFGTANQMLAAIALMLCTVVLFKMKRQQFAWVTVVPATWLVICTVTAGLEKGVQLEPIGRIPRPCSEFGDALGAGKVLAPRRRSVTWAGSCSTITWTQRWRSCS